MLHGPTIRRLSRRQFGALAAAAIASSARAARAATRPRVRVRAITAGVTLASLEDRAPFERAFRFLETARAAYERDGWEVQTTRAATQPLGEYAYAWASTRGLAGIVELDRLCARQQVVLSLGPVMTEDTPDPGLRAQGRSQATSAP